ncbi:ShlB/FhaC/HecB family hemolysin secretion/activation protein [Fulvivirga lutimaris]|uniref:ShlB/FhaC/HecB family hemolysin secretion/activation protein n=1 Tax=Fulvivirga lutimaris TaxID=1819566 RepID=UPI0012BB7608|nr:ShlB/FhaC/HecB family hemolysin secretion/activation protein [Fulvivirga lutimaris]
MNIYTCQVITFGLTSKILQFLPKHFLLILLFFLNAELLCAQHNIIHFEGEGAQFTKDIENLKAIEDSSRLVYELNDIIQLYRTSGNLLASYSINRNTTGFEVIVNPGVRYDWAALKKGNVPELILSKSGFRQRFFTDKPFRVTELNKLFQRVLGESQNSGLPFAAIKLDSVQIQTDEISAVLNYYSGPEIRFDSISIMGTQKVKKSWLSAYLGIRQGEFFNQKKVDEIGLRISELTFLNLESVPVVTFQNEEGIVHLELSDVKSNYIDGIVGFLPNEQEDGRLLITGQLDLSLDNIFSSGKRLGLQWQSLKARSQTLEAQYFQPNIFKSAINFEANFNLLKEDTLFLNREAELGFNMKQAKGSLSIFYRNRNMSVLTNEVIDNDLADINLDYYGLRYRYNKWPIRGLKKRGLGFQSEVAIGNKAIGENRNLDAGVKDAIEERSIQYLVKGRITNSLWMGKYFVLYNGISYSRIFNDYLFKNDLMRVGGLKTIRGFNENFFFASEAAISNMELQLHFQSNSYIFMFYDQAILKNSILELSQEDQPLGIGLGLALQMNTGQLNLAYALGKSVDQELDLNLSKFHFGYVARF